MTSAYVVSDKHRWTLDNRLRTSSYHRKTLARHFNIFKCIPIKSFIFLSLLCTCSSETTQIRQFPPLFNAAKDKPIFTTPSDSTCGVPVRNAYCRSSTVSASVKTCLQNFCVQTCPGRYSLPNPVDLLAHALSPGLGDCVDTDTVNRRPNSSVADFARVISRAGNNCYMFPSVFPDTGVNGAFSMTVWVWMENNEDGLKKEKMESSTLLIRHLPKELSPSEKDDLLRHFGAINVRVMGTTGQMKHAAFAGFHDPAQAAKAMTRLHQLDVLGSRLKVEIASESFAPERAKSTPWTEKKPEDDSTEKKSVPLPSEDSVYRKWSIDYPRNPRLHYMYPPPSVTILTNIANALASYPKFYVQVLHLMNKMSLPAPFGSLTTTPPIPKEVAESNSSKRRVSSSESEIESEGDTSVRRNFIPDNIYPRKKKRTHKKPKLMIEPPAEVLSQGSVAPEQILKPSEVFEHVQEKSAQKKIQMNLPPAVHEQMGHQPALPPNPPPPMPSPPQFEPDETGFGRIEPVQREPAEETTQTDMDWLQYGVISLPELESGRLPMSELRELSIFRKYERGEPSCRLYLKNLSKSVTENDLRHIYGRFIDLTSTDDLNRFDVRLMKEGRMKGQAFVTLPSEEKAITALDNTNGYIIKGKPVAVQFARSAKQKESI